MPNFLNLSLKQRRILIIYLCINLFALFVNLINLDLKIKLNKPRYIGTKGVNEVADGHTFYHEENYTKEKGVETTIYIFTREDKKRAKKFWPIVSFYDENGGFALENNIYSNNYDYIGILTVYFMLMIPKKNY